jgi:hypothetical protein
MGLTVKHAFVSEKLDGSDPQQIQPQRDWNAAHAITGSGWMLAGQVIDYLGHTIPSYLLECYGQSVSAATYPTLFASLVKQATVTFTLGTPGTVNWTNHLLPIGSKIRFRTTGALPINTATGVALLQNTDYFIIAGGYGANAFRISTVAGGTEIALSGTPSGTHTGVNAQYGVSSDLATFTVPDLRGRVTAGLDTMGGTAANRLTGQSGGVSGAAVGNAGGVQTHTLTLAELAAHTHLNDPPNPTISMTGMTVTVASGGAHDHTVTGTISSAGAHTPAGSIDTAAAHVHSIDPPSTATTAGGAGSSHTHSIPGLTGVTDTEAAHSHADTIGATATFSGSPHTHATSNIFEEYLSGGGTGQHRLIQPQTEGGGSAITDHLVANATAGGTVAVTITGAVSAGGAHAHTVTTYSSTTGSGGGGADHTHSVQIAPFNSISGGAHSHTFTGTAIAAHTHTFSAGVAATDGAHTHTATVGGTITSAQADYNTGSAGNGDDHNNVQPTFILRKLVYAG